jgi:hypothetical protein
MTAGGIMSKDKILRDLNRNKPKFDLKVVGMSIMVIIIVCYSLYYIVKLT